MANIHRWDKKETQHVYSPNKGDAIGYYIHWRSENYRRYGITVNNENGAGLAKNALIENHNALKSIIHSRNSISGADAKKAFLLQKYLNDFIYGEIDPIYKENKELTISNSFQQRFSNVMNQILVSHNPVFKDFGANWQTMGFDLQDIGEVIREFKFKNSRYKNVQGDKGLYIKADTLEAIQRGIKELIEKINEFKEKHASDTLNDIDMTKLESIAQQFDALEKALETAKLDTDNQLIKKGTDNNIYGYWLQTYIEDANLSGKQWKDKSNYEKRKYLQNSSLGKSSIGLLLIEYNDYIQTLKSLTSGLNKSDFGKIAEETFAAIFGVGAGIIQDTTNQFITQIDKAINTAVVGTSPSGIKHTRYFNGLALDVIQEKWNKNENKNKTKSTSYVYTDKYGNKSLKISASPDTVDVSVELMEDSYLKNLLGADQLNASIKNIKNIKDNIHILNGAPLDSILELGETDFINHYLNILARSYDSTWLKNDGSYNDEIYYMAAVRALTGYRGKNGYKPGDIDSPYSTKNAEYLVVNDRSKTNGLQVRVWSTENLLSIFDQSGYIRSYLTVTGLPIGLNNDFYNFGNNKKLSMGGAFMRISKLIAQLHQYKIEASLITNKLL